MLKLAVLVSGGGTNLQAIIDGIQGGSITNARIQIVISNNKNAYALRRAQENGIRHCCVSPKDYPDREAFHRGLLKALRDSGADLVVLAGYLVAIPPCVVEAFPNRIINIHPSLIPSFCGVGYYGLKVHEAALSRGVKVTGATVHFVDAGTDTGPIVLQKPVEVLGDDTPESLQRRVMDEAEGVILPRAIDLIANDRVTVVDGRVVPASI
ncbi:MAG: phosphoribosylglycinamide formyltransferase [Blautia sp.]